jgi:C4-type Zn-finger protein
LKSFIDLFKGRLELEEIIKEKLGLPYNKNIPEINRFCEKCMFLDTGKQFL